MQLTTKQSEAVQKAIISVFTDKPLYTIGGYAGTGKTTIAKEIVNLLDTVHEKLPMICAFTGKAVARLREKDLPLAQTIHRTIYNFDPETRTFIAKTREELDGDYFLVDEASMISTLLWDALKSYGLPIILVGDPGQLEPIGDDPRLMHNPDIVLDEIHRQAEGSGIIRFADDVRKGKARPSHTMYGPDILIIYGDHPKITDLLWANVVIVYYNATRHRFNRLVRKNYWGKDSFIYEGEQIIVLQNNMEQGRCL